MELFYLIISFCVGFAVAVIVKNVQDIRDIKEFERMYEAKLERIQWLKRENGRLHKELAKYQSKEAESGKGKRKEG